MIDDKGILEKAKQLEAKIKAVKSKTIALLIDLQKLTNGTTAI